MPYPQQDLMKGLGAEHGEYRTGWAYSSWGLETGDGRALICFRAGVRDQKGPWANGKFKGPWCTQRCVRQARPHCSRPPSPLAKCVLKEMHTRSSSD